MTEPSALSYAAIREYAEKVGAHHEIYDRDGRADLGRLMEKVGGRVEVRDSSESMHVAGRGEFVVFLPTHTSARRDRFTQAHEVGHYFLHYLSVGGSGEERFNRGGRNLAETQANVFASSLLMPEQPFRRAYSECDGQTWRLAHRFDVSPDAAEVRAKVLKLL